MNTVDIMRGSDLLVTIKVDDSSNQVKQVMGDNQIRLSFQENRILPFQINDWCIVFGERYQLVQMPVVRKLETYLYEYDLTMVAEGSLLARYQYLFLGDDNSLKESDFSLMGTADDFIDLVIENANRVGSGWVKGQVIPTTYKNLTFSKENCYNALSRLSQEFSTEFWIERKTVHLTKRTNDTGQTFKHGKNKGLYEIVRQALDNTGVVTRLYCFGAEKNLPADYRNYSPRLRMTDGAYFLEKNVAKFGIIEHTEIIEDIYPHRNGKITSVNAADPFIFIDANIDFNVNSYLLPGASAKVVFNTGQLAGYEFEVSRFDNTTKQFTILQNKNERALEIPNSNLKPAIGDEYVLVDITMPESYIIAAEAALTARAKEILDQISEPQVSYQVTFDPVYLRKKGYIPAIGDLVWLVDNDLQIQRRIRITSTTRSIVEEYQCQVELADTVASGTISTLISIQDANWREISQIDRSLVNNSLLNNNVIGDLRVKQGTIIFEALPITSTTTGFSEILVEISTGRLFRKI